MAVGADIHSIAPRYGSEAVKMLNRHGPVDGFGDHYSQNVDRATTFAVQPKSGYTPALGDLVVWDATLNYAVDQAAANENVDGIVVAVRSATDFDVNFFQHSRIVRLPYSSAPALGDKVEGAGSNQVRTDNSTGVGIVVAVDIVTGYVDVAF